MKKDFGVTNFYPRSYLFTVDVNLTSFCAEQIFLSIQNALKATMSNTFLCLSIRGGVTKFMMASFMD
jgi:hypothetical protein